MSQQSTSPAARRLRTGRLAAAAAAAALVATGMAAPAAEAASPARTDLPSSTGAWFSGGGSNGPVDTGAAPGDWGMSLRVYLDGKDPVGMARAARQVSDPAGHDYAHYLTPAQFDQRYGTTPAQTAKVSSWLSGFGMHVTGTTAHYLAVTATVDQVQQAFATSLHAYARVAGFPPRMVYPVSGASVPAALGHDISTVIGLDDLNPTIPKTPATPAPQAPAPRTAMSRAAAPLAAAPTTPPCSQWWGQSSSPIPAVNGRTSAIDQVCGYTPQQLRDAYGVTNSQYTGKGRTVAVVLDGSLPTMEADANTFFAAHGVPGFAPGQYSENFGPNFAASCHGSDNAPEEPLDVETVHIAAPDAKVVYVGADCGDAGGSLQYLDAHTRIVDQHLADVVTDSFATNEQGTTPATVAAWDQMFQQGALEGIGFDYASGDEGDGASGDSAGAPHMVIFPASDQWATAVGGTTLEIGKDGKVAGELGWGTNAAQLDPQGTGYLTPPPGQFLMGSGGGPSSLVSEPWYQKNVVPSTLATSGGSTAAHRVLPDLAADADPATGWLIGFTTPGGAYHEEMGGGTSGSSPLVAALEADAAQAAGHPLGFANPLIYKLRNTAAIRDIVPAPAGQEPWAVTHIPDSYSPSGIDVYLSQFDRDGSLRTAPGYDDVTGVGSATADFVRLFARR
ncbi:S53 family serine peptidase [Kitasatospora sp. MAA4]|uniref:S53 family peptidase n=1 Tax=Kitasatospora sp. MAA4 TaxID=3035093 RepID=UPI0024763244|nr:S53 family serine peptidase [Kitasatospora sp. MAA4]